MTRAALLLAALGLLLSAGTVAAQTDFSGTWTLDREISGNLSKASFEAQQTGTHTRRTGGVSGGFLGRGFGNGGRRGSNGGNESEPNGGAALTVEERTKLKELADYVKGFSSLVIAHSDHSTFAVTDAAGRSRLFPTDGSKAQHALATTTADSTTKWDGPHMVTIYTIGPARQLVFTYVLVPATKQMALRIQLEESGKPRADIPELRLVYKLTPQ